MIRNRDGATLASTAAESRADDGFRPERRHCLKEALLSETARTRRGVRCPHPAPRGGDKRSFPEAQAARPSAGDCEPAALRTEPAVRDRLVVKIHPTSSAKKCCSPTSALHFPSAPSHPPAAPLTTCSPGPSSFSPSCPPTGKSSPKPVQLYTAELATRKAIPPGTGGKPTVAETGCSQVGVRSGPHNAGSDTQREG